MCLPSYRYFTCSYRLVHGLTRPKNRLVPFGLPWLFG